MSHRLIPSLPRIKVPIGHIPQKLKLVPTEVPGYRARLEVLRQLVCRLVREERYELKYNRAEECRQYMERLIQMAVRRGPSDAYTREMLAWWLVEEDLVDKMFTQLVPRFAAIDEPYTAIYRLPKLLVPGKYHPMGDRVRTVPLGIIELKGNPFPPVSPLEVRRRTRLMEIVREGINEHRFR